jgi:predicted PurR-regulated permease PerM
VSAIGFAAWATFIAGMVDNVLGPKLIGSKAKIHPLFILLSVLGGLVTFGLAGFLIGPLFFGLAVALSEIYVLKIREIHNAH